MKKFLSVIFWILTDLLLVFSIVLFPSLFSLFGVLAAILLIPIVEWQDIIKKYIKKPIKSAIIAVLIAFVIALFPISEVITGINNLRFNPDQSQTSSIVYKEELAPSSDFFNINSNISSENKNKNTSSETDKSTTSKQSTTTSKPINNSSKVSQTTSKEENSNTVYRTPSGSKYHKSSTCGGKNSFEVSIDDAIENGLTPCKKCYK